MRKILALFILPLLVFVGCGGSDEFITKDNIGIQTDGLELISTSTLEYYSSVQWAIEGTYSFGDESYLNVMSFSYEEINSFASDNEKINNFDDVKESMQEEKLPGMTVETVEIRNVECLKFFNNEEDEVITQGYYLPYEKGFIIVTAYGKNVDQKIVDEVLQTVYVKESE